MTSDDPIIESNLIQPCLYETHSHTPLCKHATGMPTEYAAVAFQRGLKGLTITCHNPMPDGFSAHVRMGLDEFDQYVEIIEAAKQQWAGRVDVRMGIEADFFPGYESFLEKQISENAFHYVIGSVHPQVPEYVAKYWLDDPFENQVNYFRRLADAAETGLFDCISHPDLIKNQTAEAWDPQRILPEICRTLDRIAKTGLAMELNTSGVNKRIQEMNPFPAMLSEMLQRGIPVVIGADAHEPGRVGDGYLDAMDLLESVGYQELSFFLDRKRMTVPISVARQSLVAHSQR
ncbi:histidinol-phosphatase HisJ family protein [Stieleria varia]|nr:histidinol-phosphatase HisJ family protein [Stieleria varia]